MLSRGGKGAHGAGLGAADAVCYVVIVSKAIDFGVIILGWGSGVGAKCI